MARPRQFNEENALDAVVQCFWARGFASTSIKDLMAATGLTAASLYNTFGDKRAMFRTALDRYIEASVGVRLKGCEALPPTEAIRTFFAEIVRHSLADPGRAGCLIVNSALEMAPHDGEFREMVATAFERIEGFFLACVQAGQADGTINTSQPAAAAAQGLLSLLLGVRVLARVRPEQSLLEGAVAATMGPLRAA